MFSVASLPDGYVSYKGFGFFFRKYYIWRVSLDCRNGDCSESCSLPEVKPGKRRGERGRDEAAGRSIAKNTRQVGKKGRKHKDGQGGRCRDGGSGGRRCHLSPGNKEDGGEEKAGTKRVRVGGAATTKSGGSTPR